MKAHEVKKRIQLVNEKNQEEFKKEATYNASVKLINDLKAIDKIALFNNLHPIGYQGKRKYIR